MRTGYNPQTNDNLELKYELGNFAQKSVKVEVEIRDAKEIGQNSWTILEKEEENQKERMRKLLRYLGAKEWTRLRQKMNQRTGEMEINYLYTYDRKS